MRYAAMAAIVVFRVLRIRQQGSGQSEQVLKSPYCDHPKLTQWMNDSNALMGCFLAGCIFIQSEGVGFAIYFSASALMDNCAIYFVNNGEFCQYVMQVALYSMALVTFLPTCAIAYRLQGRWYDKGQWIGLKTAFVLVMVVATVASFLLCLFLVYRLGWNRFVQHLMEVNSYKVITALLVPPIVDVLQTSLLIAAALKTKHRDYGQLADIENPETPVLSMSGRQP